MAKSPSYANGIFLCIHCGERMATDRKFCKDCTTAEQRHAMDEENKKIHTERGRIFKCAFCESQKKKGGGLQ